MDILFDPHYTWEEHLQAWGIALGVTFGLPLALYTLWAAPWACCAFLGAVTVVVCWPNLAMCLAAMLLGAWAGSSALGLAVFAALMVYVWRLWALADSI